MMMVGLIASPDVILCTRSNLQSWHARSWMTEGDFIADLLPRPPTSEYTAESMYNIDLDLLPHASRRLAFAI